MRNLQGRIISTVVTIILASLVFMGCGNEQVKSLTGPADESNSAAPLVTLNKGKKSTSGSGSGWDGTIQLLSTSKAFRYRGGKYEGGRLYFASDLNNDSHFLVKSGSLTPPAGTPLGDDVTISMSLSFDIFAGEMVFTFEPHGSQFSPQAEIKIDYKDLNISVPALYYIDDNGNYIPQTPDYIDVTNKWMIIYIDHFSRYALARS